MLNDALTNFIQPGTAGVSAVGAAGATIQLGQVIDLLGSGIGTAPQNIIGNVSIWGHDPGIGRVRPDIFVMIGTAFATANGATGTFALQYAADSGSAGGYAPSTWYTSNETNAHAVAALAAGVALRMDITPAPPEVPTPRFVRLVVYPPAGTNFSAGTVAGAGLSLGVDANVSKFIPANFAVA